MDNQKYKSICDELDLLIDWGVRISDAITKQDILLDRDRFGDQIFTKLLCHAITLRRIIPTGLIPEQKGQSELWDLSSVCAIARALVESFDALFYVAIDDIDDRERDFRIALWRLHSEERRLRKLELIQSKLPEVTAIRNNIKELRNKVTEHQYYSELDKGKTKKIENGEAPVFYLSHSERNERASINHDYYNSCIMFLSAYVHTFPFSVNQLMVFKAGDEDSLHLMSMPIQYAMGFLAKSIEGMHKIFSDRLPNMPIDVTEKCAIWREILKVGLANSD